MAENSDGHNLLLATDLSSRCDGDGIVAGDEIVAITACHRPQ